MTPTTRGILLALFASVGAACFLTVYQVATALGGVVDAVLLMMTFAAVFNTLASAAEAGPRNLLRFDRLSLLLALALAALTLAGNRLAAEAIARIAAPLTSVMQQTQVFFVAVLGGIFLGETVTRRFWAGALIAFLGLCVLHLEPDSFAALGRGGTVLAAGSALCFGAMAVLTRKYIHRIRPVAVNALRLWVSVALWFLVEQRVPRPGGMSPAFVGCCAAAALFGPFLSRMALMYALRLIRPSDTTLVSLTTPLFTLPLALAVFGTVPGGRELAGGAIMLAGVALPLLELRAQDAGTLARLAVAEVDTSTRPEAEVSSRR